LLVQGIKYLEILNGKEQGVLPTAGISPNILKHFIFCIKSILKAIPLNKLVLNWIVHQSQALNMCTFLHIYSTSILKKERGRKFLGVIFM
jgi:hypothetical protein